VPPPEETRRIVDAMMAPGSLRSKTYAEPTARGFLAGETGALPDPVLEAYRSGTWEAVSESEATARLGRVPLRLEDLPVDSMTAMPWAGHWMVRVVQPLGPDSATAEILQWPAAVALDELVVAGQSAGRSDVEVDTARQRKETSQRAQLLATTTAKPAPPPADLPAIRLDAIGFHALLRANVSPDSLRALAARVR
jgi:hypothetical protein